MSKGSAAVGRSINPVHGKKRTPRRPWTDREDAVVDAMLALGRGTCEIADWLGFSRSAVARNMRRLGLSPDTHHRTWSSDDDDTVRLNFPMWPAFVVAYLIGCSETALYQRAAHLGVEKHPDHWRNPHAHLWAGFSHPRSIAKRIKPGATPHNKGIRRPRGWAPGRMAETQFKKGRPPREARNYQPIGTLRINADGYLERKVTDDHPIPARRWVGVHRLVWEAEHGPIPDGHIVRFRKGMATAEPDLITADRLELVTRADHMRRNSHANWPPELRRARAQLAWLTRTINRAKKPRKSKA